MQKGKKDMFHPLGCVELLFFNLRKLQIDQTLMLKQSYSVTLLVVSAS